MLDIKAVNIRYGSIAAVRGVSIHVSQGEVVTLIGANGAGKTTLVKAISGLLPVASGRIVFRGRELTECHAHQIAQLGISHVPEGRRLVAGMTVEENLRCGAFVRRDKAEIELDLERVMNRFPRLRERSRQHAGTLSGGERQMVALGRGLMARPELLILDEPSLGLAPIFVEEVFSIIRELKQEGRTILLIEQNARQGLACSDRAYVIRVGEVAAEGRSSELMADEALKEAYLGLN